MKNRKILAILVMVLGLMFCLAEVGQAAPMGTAFTYQGRLIDANNVADGLYDFQFKLFEAVSDGNQLGADINRPEVDVIDGYFTVDMNFGDVFDGNERWLDIGVRPGDLDDPNVYTALSPRQGVKPAPYALYAKNGGGDNDWMVSGADMYSIPTGNIGIGTTTPTSPLTIQTRVGPEIELVSTGSNADIMTSAEFRVGTSTGSSFSIMTNNFFRMRVDGVGNVGIGVTSPSGRFEVSHDGSSHDLIVDASTGNVGIGTTPGSSQKMRATTDTDATCARFDNWATNAYNYGVAGYAQGPGGTNHYGVYGYAYGGTNNWAGYFNGKLYASGAGIGTETLAGIFEVSHDGSGHDLVVDANTGNVGIGTTPGSSQKMRATTNTDATCARFDNWATNAYNYGVAGYAQGPGGTNHYGVYGYAYGGTNNWAGYFDGNMYSAKAGIGTESPQNTLDVEGSVAIGAAYSGTETAPINSLIVEGAVGIGTDSPARRLHISDAMRIEPGSAPSKPAEGDIYMDAATHKLMVYDGTAWRACW